MSKKSKALKVGRKQVVAMFVALGFKTAARWSAERLTGKIQKLPDVVNDETECEDEDAKTLLDSILKTLAGGGEVEVTAKAPKKEKAKKEKAEKDEPKKKEKKKKKEKEEPEDEEDDDEEDDDEEDDEDEDDEDEDDEDEDEDEEEEETAKEKKARLKQEKKDAAKAKAAKAKADKPKKEKKPKKVGVISSIIEFLTAASEKKPISKEKLVARLAKRFPEREATSMAKTCDVQISYHLKKAKGIEVLKGKKGYWIEGDSND